jgi:hypothetical protein
MTSLIGSTKPLLRRRLKVNYNSFKAASGAMSFMWLF